LAVHRTNDLPVDNLRRIQFITRVCISKAGRLVVEDLDSLKWKTFVNDLRVWERAHTCTTGNSIWVGKHHIKVGTRPPTPRFPWDTGRKNRRAKNQ